MPPRRHRKAVCRRSQWDPIDTISRSSKNFRIADSKPEDDDRLDSESEFSPADWNCASSPSWNENPISAVDQISWDPPGVWDVQAVPHSTTNGISGVHDIQNGPNQYAENGFGSLWNGHGGYRQDGFLSVYTPEDDPEYHDFTMSGMSYDYPSPPATAIDTETTHSPSMSNARPAADDDWTKFTNIDNLDDHASQDPGTPASASHAISDGRETSATLSTSDDDTETTNSCSVSGVSPEEGEFWDEVTKMTSAIDDPAQPQVTPALPSSSTAADDGTRIMARPKLFSTSWQNEIINEAEGNGLSRTLDAECPTSDFTGGNITGLEGPTDSGVSVTIRGDGKWEELFRCDMDASRLRAECRHEDQESLKVVHHFPYPEPSRIKEITTYCGHCSQVFSRCYQSV